MATKRKTDSEILIQKQKELEIKLEASEEITNSIDQLKAEIKILENNIKLAEISNVEVRLSNLGVSLDDIVTAVETKNIEKIKSVIFRSESNGR